MKVEKFCAPALARRRRVPAGVFGEDAALRSPKFYREPMQEPRPETGMPASRKLLCAVYATIALAALIATWSQNVAYFNSISDFFPGLGTFVRETKVTPASRSITVDILFFFLAAAILMVIEARKHGVRFVWAYVVGGVLIAISVTFPLFLLARELRLSASQANPSAHRGHNPARVLRRGDRWPRHLGGRGVARRPATVKVYVAPR